MVWWANWRRCPPAGANLEFVIARRAPEQPGKGVVFVTPLNGAKQMAAAEAAGFLGPAACTPCGSRAPTSRGLGGKIAGALAEAGINLRGLSAAAIGTKFVCYLALDTAEDAEKATDTLKNVS